MKYIKCFILLLSLNCQSYWDENSLAHLKKYDYPIENTFISSVYGICQEERYKFKEMPSSVHDVYIENDKIENGPYPVKLLIQKNKMGIQLKSPLTIVMPGAFNNNSSGLARRLMYEISMEGHHVAILTDPWSKEFVQLKTNLAVGDPLDEGGFNYEIIKDLVGQLKNANLVTSVHLVGVSHGAFLSVVVAGLDQDDARIIDGTVTAFSPPHHLGKTMQNLDREISEIKSYLGKGVVVLLGSFARICKRKDNFIFSNKISRHAHALSIGLGFQFALRSVASEYNEIHQLDLIPGGKNKMFSKKYHEWKKNLNFENFLKDFSPRTLPILWSKFGEFDYWARKIQTDPSKVLRVLTSNDDFLNENNAWREQEYAYVVPRGGHYGFRAITWYEDLFRIAY